MPKGLNQYIHDPRQDKFIEYYTEAGGATFSNALQSAIKAGYKPQYAKNILAEAPKWLVEKLDKLKTKSLVNSAEKNIAKFLDDHDNARIQADMTKFTLERLNKTKYGLKQEVTHNIGTVAGFSMIQPADEAEMLSDDGQVVDVESTVIDVDSAKVSAV